MQKKVNLWKIAVVKVDCTMEPEVIDIRKAIDKRGAKRAMSAPLLWNYILAI